MTRPPTSPLRNTLVVGLAIATAVVIWLVASPSHGAAASPTATHTTVVTVA